jgi:allophanate hydrolase
LLAPAGNDAFLAAIGRVFHADTALPLGAIGEVQPRLAALAAAPNSDEIAIAVVGAHLSGMPLNAELRALGARLLERTMTAPDYRLYALAESDPPRPGLVRIAPGRGKAIEVEVWALPAEGFGRFVAAVAPPLSIGTLRLAGGRTVKGFLCEAEAVKSAQDISRCGGWRAYLAETAVLGASIARHKASKRAVAKGKARKKTSATKKIAKRSARGAQ